MGLKPPVVYPAGEKVILAPLEAAHVARYIGLSADPELVTTMGWQPFVAGETARFRESLAALTVPGCDPGEVIVFSILDRAGGTSLGYVCLKGFDPAKHCTELGIALMDTKYRNGGCGTEALKLALRYGFEALGLDLIALTVFPDNHRAIRAYEKVGFVAGELLPRSWRLPDGTLADLRLMECRHD